MSGFLTFMDRYRDEAACIAALAKGLLINNRIGVGLVIDLGFPG